MVRLQGFPKPQMTVGVLPCPVYPNVAVGGLTGSVDEQCRRHFEAERLHSAQLRTVAKAGHALSISRDPRDGHPAARRSRQGSINILLRG